MAKSDLYHELTIRLSQQEYPIYIGANCLSDGELLARYATGKQALIVTNDTIALLYLDKVKQALAPMVCDVVILPDGEIYKNQDNLFHIFNALLERQHHRDTTLFALGGGVIGDITGFAASCYQRGVKFVQLPTTLLAQVDASVGGKTAINHPLGKNMIGSFYQPQAVIMDLTTLDSLPDREFRAGFAEIIKYGLIEGGEFYSQLTSLLSVDLLKHKNKALLSNLIAQCCQIKASIVQEDERELGKRVLLNLGHTFAHALEAYTHYEHWLHGEAVAIGLFCAALMSHQLGHLSALDVTKIDLLLQQAKLPQRIPKNIDLMQLQKLMFHDKKILNNKLRFVLLNEPGNCYLDSSVTTDSLHQTLTNAVEGEQE